LYGQNNSILVSWQTIGSHEVVLTVTDSSGNTNSASTTVVVLDATLPVLQQSSLNVLPSSGMIDQALKCSVTANDPFDSSIALRYHWDLNPELDSDGNGDERDDPDRIGSSADLTFKQAGTYTVVVTVFDPSNNSDSHAFSIKIGEPAEEGSIAGMLLVVLFIGTLTMGIALVGHRRWQHGLAVELLIGRGLNAAEAKAHIAHVIDARKTPLFASAVVLAGLDMGDVTSGAVQEEQSKAAELESIYGSTQSAPVMSAFAPPTAAPAFSAGSQAAAADALALLNDQEPRNEPSPTTQMASVADDLMPAEAPQTVVKSGGVQLPSTKPKQPAEKPEVEAPAPEPPKGDGLTHLACTSCGHKYAVALPDGVPKAIVACPACNTDNIAQA
jgi:PKD repeat protein